MSNFLQFTVFGVMFGAGYAIAATGLVVTYTTSGVFNFAQGAVGMIAAFSYWELVSEHHVPIAGGPGHHPDRGGLDQPERWSNGCSCAGSTGPRPSDRSWSPWA